MGKYKLLVNVPNDTWYPVPTGPDKTPPHTCLPGGGRCRWHNRTSALAYFGTEDADTGAVPVTTTTQGVGGTQPPRDGTPVNALYASSACGRGVAGNSLMPCHGVLVRAQSPGQDSWRLRFGSSFYKAIVQCGGGRGEGKRE